MAIKVFLSHQRADSVKAAEISTRLSSKHGIQSYLDVIDPYLGKPGEDLARHIRAEMSKCTQLLAVVSYNTKESQWVPWEIGVATEKDFPLATFANYTSAVPEFLRAWPYLRTLEDVDKYAEASKRGDYVVITKRSTLNEGLAKRAGSETFFSDLRRSLGQLA
jgi:hypothetical protein